MLFYHLTLTSLALFLPAQIAAQCSACTSYTAALKSCQTGSANLTQIGSVVDTDDVHCMCQSSSSYTEMNSCTGCTETDYTLEESIDPTILDAWTSTCNADNLYDDKQAVACWQGQPTNYLPCIERTGDTTGGGSSPSTTLPQRYVCAPRCSSVLVLREMRL